MDGFRKWTVGVSLALLAFARAAGATALDAAADVARSRVAVVSARTLQADGSYEEEQGNGLLWTTGGRIYTLADLHTLMSGEEGSSGRIADQIVVKVGRRSSRARLVWPPEGRRDVGAVDIAILELEDSVVGVEAFPLDAFQDALGDLPRDLYLAAPGHRSRVLPLAARAVKYGPQWFLYHELARGDSGGLVFAVQEGRVVPHGFVSAIGSLPGEAARGTVIYGRDAMRLFIGQFLAARARLASQP